MIRAALVVFALTSGCSGFIDNQAAKSTLKILGASMDAAARLPDVQLAREALPSGIIQLDAFARAYPDHRQFRVMHAQSLCQYATGFVFDDWEDATLAGRAPEADALARRMVGLLDACVDANLALLPPAWRAARAQGVDGLVPLLPSATAAHVPALLAIATADAVNVALSPMTGLAALPAITAMLQRSAALKPGFNDAAAELLLGTLLAAQHTFLGGPDGAAELAAARRLAAPGALIVDVMIARATNDRAALARAAATDVRTWPERRLANELALRKARRYLGATAGAAPAAPPPL